MQYENLRTMSGWDKSNWSYPDQPLAQLKVQKDPTRRLQNGIGVVQQRSMCDYRMEQSMLIAVHHEGGDSHMRTSIHTPY